MKKVLIIFLIFAYLNCYFGCTTTKTFIVGGSELPESLNQSNDYDLKIMTVDSVYYLIRAGMYRLNNDTLIGMIQENNGKISELVNIPLKNIALAKFNVEAFDAGKSITVFAIAAGVTLSLFLFFVGILASNW